MCPECQEGTVSDTDETSRPREPEAWQAGGLCFQRGEAHLPCAAPAGRGDPGLGLEDRGAWTV